MFRIWRLRIVRFGFTFIAFGSLRRIGATILLYLSAKFLLVIFLGQIYQAYRVFYVWALLLLWA